MDPKGANLASTDLLEISQLVSGSYVTKSITGAEIISGATTGFVPTSRTLTINGTTQDLSADRTFTISTGITIGTTVITSGVDGRLLFQNAGVVSQSANMTYDNTNGIFNITGIINSVIQHTALTNYTGFGGFQLNVSGGSERAFLKLNPQTGEVKIGATGSGYFTTLYAQGLEAMRIFASTRNVGINTTTDAGYKLDVNGTARFVGQTTIGSASFSSSSNLMTLISNAGTCNVRITGGGQFRVSSSLFASVLQASDYTECVRVLLNGQVRLTATSADWLRVTNWAQNANGNVSAELGTFGTAYATINASAQVEIASTTKGFLPPRMTTTQKNAIASPATGLMVYDTTLNLISVYNGTIWISL